LVLGAASFSAVAKALHPAQDSIGREINQTVMSPAEFRRKRGARDGFALSVAKSPKIWLIGDADEFAELLQGRVARAP
jgi:hypothetical protein